MTDANTPKICEFIELIDALVEARIVRAAAEDSTLEVNRVRSAKDALTEFMSGPMLDD